MPIWFRFRSDIRETWTQSFRRLAARGSGTTTKKSHSMESQDRKTLIINRTYILDNVRFTDVKDELIEKGILSDDDVNRCKCLINTPRDQMASLLDILPHKGPLAYGCFLSALMANYGWAVDKLNECRASLAQGPAPAVRERVREPYTEVSHDVLRILTKSSALNKHKMIMRGLGLSEDDLFEAEYADSRDIAEQFYQCMQKWINKEGRNATVARLLVVLRNEGCNDAADKIDGYSD